MQLLPLDRLGPHVRDARTVDFGFLLPWVSAENENRLFVKIIHERDQFLKEIPARRFPLTHSTDPEFGDFWSGTVDLGAGGGAWGEFGRYLYRFELESPLLGAPLDWIVDPYAREYGTGHQSAFTLGYEDHFWGAVENTWKTPPLHDLIVYELMIHEFDWDLTGAAQKLNYLRDLGVNCVELMPVANVARSIDWGFEPIGPFGPDERFGKRRDLQQFVEAAHQQGIAVVLDMIHGHTGGHFAYEYIYSKLGYHENPFMGPFSKDMFGPSVDYRRPFARNFYYTVNHYWLDRYHIDGIRYDCVPNWWDGPVGVGYANLVYNTYKVVKATGGEGHWQRFFAGDRLRLIQCAEQLEAPVEAVQKTFSNAAWQNETLSAFESVASGNRTAISDLGNRLGLMGYPVEEAMEDEAHWKSAFQYLENHDHSRFLCKFGTIDLAGGILEGDRNHWYKLQPYAIALLLAKGIPMLWEGQELGESYHVPESGFARIGRLRPVRWEFFYDEAGRKLVGLFRKLVALRRDVALLRRGDFFFHNNWDEWQSRGALLFSRESDAGYLLAALNFTDQNINTRFWFPRAGNYREMLHGEENLSAVPQNSPVSITLPSNYGRVWLLESL